jgi:endonuclease VIII
VAAVGDLDAVVTLLHRLLTANRDRSVQITTGDPRPGRTHYVHGRAGLPCRRCGTRLQVGDVGPAPTQRPGYHCPTCQPRRPPTAPGDWTGGGTGQTGDSKPDTVKQQPNGPEEEP